MPTYIAREKIKQEQKLVGIRINCNGVIRRLRIDEWNRIRPTLTRKERAQLMAGKAVEFGNTGYQLGLLG